MNFKLKKNNVILMGLVLIILLTLSMIYYKNRVYNINKELFNNTIYQEAKTHFNNLKVFRAWNASYSGVYVKAENNNIMPNEYLTNNHLYTKDNELLVKINPAWMTRQVSELINKHSKYSYSITSLKPLNPSNKADDFEKEALSYFEKNSDKEFYVKTDTNKDLYNFMGKLIVEQSCLQCHAIQGYKLGEVRGGIRVSIPMEIYKENFKDVEFHYKTQIYISILFAVIIFFIFLLIINKLFKNQENLQNLKNKYKILYDRYDYAVSGSKLGLWDWNLQTNKIYFSKQWKEMLGYSEDELSNSFENWDERVHPDDKEKACFDIIQNQKHSTEYYENVHRLKHKNGSWVWILDKGKTIFDEKGNALRMVGFHTDITKLKELEKEISKLKKVIEHSPISIVITDVDGIIEYVNPCFCKTTGYSYKEALGSNPRVLKSEYTSSFEYQNLWNTLLSKKTWRGRFKNKRKDGSEFWESAIITPIFDEQNEIVNFLAIKQEITKEIYLKEEIKNKEEMMIAQSRHAAMGEMISMIAHQWRQPISVIAMASNNILADIELDMLDNEELKENIESTLEQTKYLSQTIEDFRNFFRPNKEKELVNPLDVINDTLSIMDKSLFSHNINVSVSCSEDLKVMIYSRELLQVFMNIIKNAKESFLNKNIKNQNIEISIFKQNNIVRIEIYNNAGGIDDKIKDSIFDPYFTTKDEKTGTGLGLYMSKTIIERHLNGKLGFYNCRDGVSFFIDLPLFIKQNN